MSDEAPRLARPYLLTGGRTSSEAGDLPIEALVVCELDHLPDGLQPIEEDVLQCCAAAGEPLAIAEVAAHLRVPVGVARVLVSDLAALGHLVVHENDIDDITIVRRLLDGIRAR